MRPDKRGARMTKKINNTKGWRLLPAGCGEQINREGVQTATVAYLANGGKIDVFPPMPTPPRLGADFSVVGDGIMALLFAGKTPSGEKTW